MKQTEVRNFKKFDSENFLQDLRETLGTYKEALPVGGGGGEEVPCCSSEC